jgi:hypothetical protein
MVSWERIRKVLLAPTGGDPFRFDYRRSPALLDLLVRISRCV